MGYTRCGKSFFKLILGICVCAFVSEMVFLHEDVYAGCETKWSTVKDRYDKDKNVSGKKCSYNGINYFLPKTAITKNSEAPVSIDNIRVCKGRKCRTYIAYNQGEIGRSFFIIMVARIVPWLL